MLKYAQVKIRQDSTENWLKANPILRERELAADITEKRLKLGDGVTDWKSLKWCDTELVEILISGFDIYINQQRGENE